MDQKEIGSRTAEASLKEARRIYSQLCDYSPEITETKYATHIRVAALLEEATGKRDSYRFLDPSWKDKADEATNKDKESEWYFRFNFTNYYAHKVNDLRNEIAVRVSSPPYEKAGVTDKIVELLDMYEEATKLNLKLEVTHPGYVISEAEKLQLLSEAGYYRARVGEISALEKKGRDDLRDLYKYEDRLSHIAKITGVDVLNAEPTKLVQAQAPQKQSPENGMAAIDAYIADYERQKIVPGSLTQLVSLSERDYGKYLAPTDLAVNTPVDKELAEPAR